MFHLLMDDIVVDPIQRVADDPDILWTILGIVAGVVAVTVVLVVVLVKRRKNKRKADQ